MIKRITTTYKNLNLDIEDLAEINYFVGKNGSGKTLLMEFISNYIKTLQENQPEFNNFLKENNSIVIDNTNAQGYLHAYQSFGFELTNQKSTVSGSYIHEYELTHKLVSLFFGDDATFISTPYFGIKQGDNILGLKETPAGFQSLMNIWLTVFINYPFKKLPVFWFAAIDEIDRHLHPKMAKKLPSLLNEMVETMKVHILKTQGVKSDFQFFLTSHSPFLVRAALEEDNQKIYHLDKCQLERSIDKIGLKHSNGIHFDQIIADLGFEMKDIYYPNCLIYVEGPTDIIYIHYWLKLYIKEKLSINEKKYKDYQKGIDFDFVEFGGTLASHLTATKHNPDNQFDTNLTTSLQNMFSSNRNVLFITDDDDGKSNFENAKNRIEELLNQNNEKGFNNEFIKCASVKTIEDFIGDNINADKSKPKLKASVNNVLCWKDNQDLKLSDFHPKLEQELICKVYDFIKSCQNS